MALRHSLAGVGLCKNLKAHHTLMGGHSCFSKKWVQIWGKSLKFYFGHIGVKTKIGNGPNQNKIQFNYQKKNQNYFLNQKTPFFGFFGIL